MENPARDSSLGTGVYYLNEDYIGLGKRLLILAVDFCVIALGAWITDLLWHSLPPNETATMVLGWGFPVSVLVYLTAIKASDIRTLGYRLIGVKVVTFKGKRPSVLRMIFRLFIWLLGPLNIVMDLIWVGIDQDRQALRDRFAGTCVVKVNASPIREAPIHLSLYNAFGLSLMLPTVCRPNRAL
jgi:uncharacterized RDD family membrane protein YckC